MYGTGATAGTTNPTSWTYDTAQYVSAPSRTGYTFNGWYLTGTGTNVNYSTAVYGSTSSPATAIANGTTRAWGGSAIASTYFKNLSSTSGGAVTLTAQWTANNYTLTVDPNGGNWNTHTTEQLYTQAYDTTKLISDPTPPTGYSFYGWLQEGYGINTAYGKKFAS